ncbi:MAG: HigA family addiction module antidote protein [Candidatus Hydrogenedentes bacterium]|nr:HigA family addiction module antidote protein [Candidatus Hydrogenedentota bacterium]
MWRACEEFSHCQILPRHLEGKTTRMHKPPHPGEIIREFCIDPLGLTVGEAAHALGVTRKTLSALINGRAGISPEMALRLSKVFGRSPEGWLRLQTQFDLWRAEQSLDVRELKRIRAA